MVRLKLYVSLLITVAVMTGVAVTLVCGHRAAVLDEAREGLDRLPLQYAQVFERRSLELFDAGNRISGGVLRAYLYTLRENMTALRETEKELYSLDFAASHEGEDLAAARVTAVQEKTDLVQGFVGTLADKVAAVDPSLKENRRAEFVEQSKLVLTNCLASAVDTCLFKMTYEPLTEEVMPQLQKDMAAARIDFAIVLDERGIGRAHSRNARWSGDTTLSDKYPVVFAARKDPRRSFRDILYFDDAQKFFLVTVTPIRDDQGVLGFVVLGSSLVEFVKEEANLLAADLTVLNGDRLLVSTTSDEDSAEMLGQGRTTTKDAPQTFETDRLLAASMPFPGSYTPNTLRAVFSRSKAVITDFASSTMLWLLLTALVVFLAGVFGLGLLLGQFLKPLEEIDAGIHRIISGDREYFFPFEYKEPIAKSLGETLNLMVAVLLGKPLPEEEDDTAFFQETLKFSEHAPARGGAPIDAATVFAVNPDEYYKSLFIDFVSAQQAAGNDMSKLTRVKFLEKVAQNETQLRLRTGKANVRFVVQVVDNEVRLHPVYKD
jgi:hypothetical protein